MARSRTLPTPTGPVEGAVVGTFVVGDGTLVGQPPQPPFNKPALILKGKTFTAAIFTGDFLIAAFPNRPALILKGKQVSLLADSTVVPGKSRLLLAGKAFILIIPEFAHMGRSALVLKGKAFTLGVGGIATVGKPSLILRGRHLVASEVGLVPSIPLGQELFPTDVEELVLVGAVPQSLDLVPTVEEFR